MKRGIKSTGFKRVLPAVLALAGATLALPGVGLAVDSGEPTLTSSGIGYVPFTPARVDSELAKRVAAIMGEDGLRFTPANKSVARVGERTVTVAVRVDNATARAISVRGAIESVGAKKGRSEVLAVTPTSYNLGIARGYQSFAQPTRPVEVAAGLRDLDMPDLSTFRSGQDQKSEKSSRFTSRIAVENEGDTGRAPRTLEGAGEQRVDVSTSYRVMGNLGVTAGIRVSQDRNRLNPLTDGVEDDQAVYVGTQLKF